MKPEEKKININDLDQRKSPFTTPEGYFESLNERILQKTEGQMPIRPEQSNSSRRSFLRPILYMAALFAGAFLMVRIMTTLPLKQSDSHSALVQKNSSHEHSSESVDGADLGDYATSQIDEYTLFECYCEKNQQ